MNRERSKMFAQKMKEVFRSKSHHSEHIPKISGKRECDSRLDLGRDSLRQKKNENFPPGSKFANGPYGSPHICTIPEHPTGEFRPSNESCANRADSLNTQSQQLMNKSEERLLPNNESPTNDDKCSLPRFGSSEITTIHDRIVENVTVPNFNLQSGCVPCKCDLATCRQHCPNGGPICANNNVISTNNNYLSHSFPAEQGDNLSLFSSVLKYAFGGEKSNRNDFTILALGIHHYVKEVFNALDSSNNGYILYEDLQILCKILGKHLEDLDKSIRCTSTNEDNANKSFLCSNNSCEIHLHFGKFSELICSIFDKEGNNNCLEKRNNSHLVNTIVNITRRNKSLDVISQQLEELENEYLKLTTNPDLSTSHNVNQNVKDRGKFWSKEHHNKNDSLHTNNRNLCLENLKLQKIVLLQQQELQCLREVIEDMRVSLQSSDAENLNLRVREVKMSRRNSFSSLSDDLASKRASSSSSSTGDGKDSIDRLILSFPSNDQLFMDSSESLLSIGSSTRASLSRSQNESSFDAKSKNVSNEAGTSSESLLSAGSTKNPATHQHTSHSPHQVNQPKEPDLKPELLLKLKRRERTPHKEIEDDLSLEKEIQTVYETLSVTRTELEDTRNDLENSVAEIRTQNTLLDHLKEKLMKVEKLADSFSLENENLKEKTVFLQMEEENCKIKMASLAEELAAVRAQLGAQGKEVTTLSQELRHLKVKRQRDLKQLSEARHIIATSLIKAKRTEDELKALLNTNRQSCSSLRLDEDGPSVPKRISTTGKSPQLDTNNNRTLKKLTTSKCTDSERTNAAYLNSFSNLSPSFSNDCNGSVINGTNNSDYCNNKKSPRIICYEETRYNEDRNRSNTSPYDVRRSEFDNQKRGPIQERWKEDHHTLAEKPGSQSTAISNRVETAAPKSFAVMATENKGSAPFREKVLMSPHNEDKPTMEVKPNLIKPLAITLPLVKDPPFNDPVKRRLKPSSLQKADEKGEEFLENSCREGESPKMPNWGKEDSTFYYDEEAATRTKMPKTLGCSSNESGLRTSTQILEGLEAEVEFLRKSLEDPSLG